MESEIKKFIEQSIPELSGRLYPLHTEELQELSVAYKIMPSGGGHLKQAQLELKIISSLYAECKQAAEKLLGLLDMEEDDPFIVTDKIKFHSGVAGGGTLFNDGCQMWEDTLIFMILWRQ